MPRDKQDGGDRAAAGSDKEKGKGKRGGKGKKKRKKSKQNGNSAKKSKKEVAAKKIPTKPSTPLSMTGPKFDKQDLKCTVCFDFPEKEIFQCENGHLMCKYCFHRVIQGNHPFCPNCRVRLSRERKYRNRFAEVVLSSLMVECTNNGCNESMQYGNLKEHQARCGFRKLRCKFHPLGCNWEGISNNLKDHLKKCQLKKATAKDILKNVIEKRQMQENKHEREQAKLSAQKSVCDLLSSLCGNICVKDIVIERDEICDEMCSKTFSAFGMTWEMILVKPNKCETCDNHGYHLRDTPQRSSNRANTHVSPPSNDSKADSSSGSRPTTYALRSSVPVTSPSLSIPPVGNLDNEEPLPPEVQECIAIMSEISSSNEEQKLSEAAREDSKNAVRSVGVKLRVVSSVKRKTRLRFFVLKGPGLDYEMVPTIHRAIFKRSRSKESEVCYLGFKPEDAEQVHELAELHLRVGLVDTSRRVDQEFSSVNQRRLRVQADEGIDGATDNSSDSDLDEEYDDYTHDDLDSVISTSTLGAV